ncbi:hypothetical protein [Paracoccus hibiscisoli]|uniref:hypothetical protein n=1 Tax=Paracoccus hibiscisoli TaxID=2023261 RepID=UPI001FE82072|nr:hypothetical protein [Paracoccus hibiscisoli]
MADHLLAVTCRRMNRARPLITARVMQSLMAYDWPGNVRELRNVIERAVILTTGGKLVLDLAAPLPHPLPAPRARPCRQE